VSFGHYKNPTVVREPHVRAVSALLQGVVFRCVGFEDAIGPTRTGDFIYLDPPYAPETTTSFVGYNAEGFDEEKHKALFSAAAGMNGEMLMSNADVPLVRAAFPASAFTTTVISCRRAIHSKDPSARTNEVLIQKKS
jgi:DNA adenine methylase